MFYNRSVKINSYNHNLSLIHILENTDIQKNNYAQLLPGELFEQIEKQSVVVTPVSVDVYKRQGFANIKEFEIEYHKRIAMSFASFILTIIGVSLSSRKTKGGMGPVSYTHLDVYKRQHDPLLPKQVR